MLAVLLIHLLAGSLLLLEQSGPPSARQAVTVLRLIRPPSAPLPAPRPAPAAKDRPAPRALMQSPGPSAITLQVRPDATDTAPTLPAPPAASAAVAPAPLDLRLPTRIAAPPPSSLAEQIRADDRANSPRESAVERMANALGAKGWTVIELADGGRKVSGPFGECKIIRPSMVDAIPGHPHAGLLRPREFSCGGIEKGSLKHERPK